MSTHKRMTYPLHTQAPDIESVFQQSGFNDLAYHEIQQIDESVSAAKRWKLLTEIHLHPEAPPTEEKNHFEVPADDEPKSVDWPPVCKLPPLFENSQPHKIIGTDMPLETDLFTTLQTRNVIDALHDSDEAIPIDSSSKQPTNSLQTCFARLQPAELKPEPPTQQDPAESLDNRSLLQAMFIRLEQKQSLPSQAHQESASDMLCETDNNTSDNAQHLWPLAKAV